MVRYSFKKVNGVTRLAHRVIAENRYKRKLKHNEIVHHKNNDGKDNSCKNIEVMDALKHRRYHNPKVPMKTLTCEHCGGKFSVSLSYYKWRKKHNSPLRFDTKECMYAARKKSKNF